MSTKCSECKEDVARWGHSQYCSLNPYNVRERKVAEQKVDGFAEGARPLCVFCNTPWTDDMIDIYDIDASHGPGSYDFGPENETATLTVECSSCDRLIYSKKHNDE